jgi:hypothetical protein
MRSINNGQNALNQLEMRSIKVGQNALDRLEMRSINLPAIPDFPAFYLFSLEICHFFLTVLEKRKNTKTSQNIRK